MPTMLRSTGRVERAWVSKFWVMVTLASSTLVMAPTTSTVAEAAAGNFQLTVAVRPSSRTSTPLMVCWPLAATTIL